MAATLPFTLLTPTGVVFDGLVAQVTAINPLGEFGVLPEHINYITSLEPGVAVVTLPDGNQRFFVVSGGLAEVKDGKLTMLASTAERAEDMLDGGELANAVLTAQEKLRHVSFYEPDYEIVIRELHLAEARQRAAHLRSS